MSARLAYRNATPEANLWAIAFRVRTTLRMERRHVWMSKLYDEHGVPDVEDPEVRGAFIQGETFSGIAWPTDIPLPKGWFRPVKTPELIRPKSGTTAGRTALAEMQEFDHINMRRELREQFGMPTHLFVGLGMYYSGVRIDDEDAVWVSWGTRDVEDQIDASDASAHGWERMPLIAYIEKFGEEAL